MYSNFTVTSKFELDTNRHIILETQRWIWAHRILRCL